MTASKQCGAALRLPGLTLFCLQFEGHDGTHLFSCGDGDIPDPKAVHEPCEQRAAHDRERIRELQAMRENDPWLWEEDGDNDLASLSSSCPILIMPRVLERLLAPLTFQELRRANLERLPHFKNPHGEPAHTEADGSDWSLGEWSNAVLGELGEAANLIKKVQRGDLTLEEARPALAREFADVVTYLDLLAYQAGVDLGEATVQKWNEVSERVGFEGRL